MGSPRFTIRRLMIAVAVVALVLAALRSGDAIAEAVRRRYLAATARFNAGTTNPGVGIPPNR